MKYCLNIKGITSLMGMLDPGEKATITPSKIEGYYDVVIEVTMKEVIYVKVACKVADTVIL